MFVALKWQELLENMMIPQFLEILIQNSSIAMKRPLRFWKSLEENYNSLINEFEKLGNPFICNSDENDLIQVNTRDIMVQEVVEAIHEIEEIGKLQADTFISERIVTKTWSEKNKFLFHAANTFLSQTTSRKAKQDLKKGI